MREDDLCELGVVKTATPCEEPWENMRGSSAVRFCDRCRLNVYDFSQLTANEARELLRETEGRLCARIFTRGDGTVLTRDCPTGVTQQRKTRIGGVAGAVAAAAMLGAGVAAALAPSKSCESCESCESKLVDIISANKPGRTMGFIMVAPQKKTAR